VYKLLIHSEPFASANMMAPCEDMSMNAVRCGAMPPWKPGSGFGVLYLYEDFNVTTRDDDEPCCCSLVRVTRDDDRIMQS
jgi:hypothetical protein